MKINIHTSVVLLARLSLVLTATPLIAVPHETGIRGQAFAYNNYGGWPIQTEAGIWVGDWGVHFPVAASITVVSARNNREVAHLRADFGGNFAVSLPPGEYILLAEPLGGFLNFYTLPEPMEVTV